MSRSIQQLPNNSGTTSVTEVYTSTGFNAGDPVYFQNGDYKSPANLTALTSVNFSFPNSAPFNPYGEGGTLYPAFSYAQMQTAGISGGSVRRFAAVLTSGNIVQVFINHAQSTVNINCPYFRIISPSGAVVAGPTLISATYTSSSGTPISVVALTGGGFVVGWINSAGGTINSVNYAMYSNTGTVTYAVVQDTSFAAGSNTRPIEMTSLANGGFAIAIKNSSAIIFIRAYNSIGTGAYSTINTGITTNSNTVSFGFVSRSDSSVCCVDYTSATAINYAIYSSTGTTIVASTSFAVNSAAYQSGADASVLSDGTTIVFAYYNTSTSYSGPALRFLPTGNVLGSQIFGIPEANLYAQFSYGGYYIGVLGITGNNVMLFFADGFGYMQYAFYNSSGVCISGSNSTGAIPIQIPGGFAGPGNRITLLESSGSVFAYWNYATNAQSPVQQICAKINTSTFLIVPVLSTAGAPTLVTGQPTGALALNGVTPLGPSYYSTSSSSTVVTNTPATVTSATSLVSVAIDSIASCSLPNGNAVIVYRETSGRPVTAKVLSSIGAGLATIPVSTVASSSAVVYGVKVAALSGGGFVVMFASSSSSSAYTLQVYSSAYELTATTTVTATQSYQLQFNFDICGLLNNNFAIIYSNDGTNGAVRVYNSALSNIYSVGVPNTPNGMAIAGNSWGGFAVSYYGSGTGYFRSYVPIGTSTWVQSVVATYSQSAYVQDPQMVATQSGMYVITGYNSGYPAYFMSTDAGVSNSSYTGALTSWPVGSTSAPTSYPMMGIGLTGNGMVVFVTAYDGSGLGIANMSPQVTWSQGQQVPYQQGGTFNLGDGFFSNTAYTIASIAGSYTAQPRVTPLIGNNCLISYKNNNNYPSFIIVNGNSYSSVYSVIASTTPSSPIPVVPATVSGVISGTFAGVAITSATAGSTGQLATNGQALLDASYTGTAAGVFDSTGGAVRGVKGTFNGRSVNLQGNS